MNRLFGMAAMVVLAVGGCARDGAQRSSTDTGTLPPVVTRIEQAHHADDWRSHQALQSDITVDFGGQRVIDGVLIFSTDGGRSRLTLTDGTVAVFDGQTAWVTGDGLPDARFHVLTWPYFAAVMYKLRDGGATLTADGPLPLQPGQPARQAWKLTFAPGTGDAPDDWYILFPGEDGALDAMAYIVTFGKPKDAPQDPHAILYHDLKPVSGVPLSHRWTFHDYSRETGISEALRGEAKLSNPRFITPGPDTFARPVGAQEAKLPPTS